MLEALRGWLQDVVSGLFAQGISVIDAWVPVYLMTVAEGMVEVVNVTHSSSYVGS